MALRKKHRRLSKCTAWYLKTNDRNSVKWLKVNHWAAKSVNSHWPSFATQIAMCVTTKFSCSFKIYANQKLQYYNSAVKYIYVLPTAFIPLHLAYAGKYILQITIIILQYYLNFEVLIYRLHKFFKTYLICII
jgi:hypothetical protein